MHKAAAYLLPHLLVLAHVASAVPAPLVPRATGSAPLVPRAIGSAPLVARATGSLPEVGPEASQIQISYALAPSVAPIDPLPVQPAADRIDPLLKPSVGPIDPLPDQPPVAPVDPLPVKPSVAPVDPLPVQPSVNPVDPLPVKPSVAPISPLPGVLPFGKRQDRLGVPLEGGVVGGLASIIVDPTPAPSVDINSYIPYLENMTLDGKVKRAPSPTPPPNSYVNPDATTVVIPGTTPAPVASPIDINSYISYLEGITLDGKVKRAPSPIIPPNSYANPDVTTVIDPAPTGPAASLINFEPLISQLAGLGLDAKVKRAPSPVLPPNSYLQPDATTVFIPDTTPAPVAPSIDLNSYISYLEGMTLGGKAKRAPPASAYLNPDVITVTNAAPSPSPAAASPADIESVIAQLESMSALFRMAKRAPAPTPPASQYIPTDVTTVSDVPFQTPVAATPTQPLASVVLESYIPELQSLGLLFPYAKRDSAATAAPTPTTTAAAVYAKRQDDGDWWNQIIEGAFPVENWGDGAPAATVVGVSQEAPAPTVMGVSEAGAQPTVVGVSAS